MEGQTKAAAAFTGNFDVYGPTLFKLCMHVAYWPMLMICYVAFTIKGRSNLDKYFNEWIKPVAVEPERAAEGP